MNSLMRVFLRENIKYFNLELNVIFIFVSDNERNL